MLVLGIDPGTATTGYGLVAEQKGGRLEAVTYGTILTSPQEAGAQRLLSIYEKCRRLLAEHHPDAVAMEELFFNRNVTTAISVGQARGVIVLAAAQAGIPVVEYTPSQVKVAVTGQGRAAKGQVAYMVQALLGLARPPQPDDVSDALAVAICHLQAAGQSYGSLRTMRLRGGPR